MKILLNRIFYSFYNPRVRFFVKLLVLMGLGVISTHAFADDGSDLLQGTDSSAMATLNGTGKKFIYMIEGVIAIGSYIKTKNLFVLLGIIVIAVFFNIVIKMAGGQ